MYDIKRKGKGAVAFSVFADAELASLDDAASMVTTTEPHSM
jgi:hypothetical protein